MPRKSKTINVNDIFSVFVAGLDNGRFVLEITGTNHKIRFHLTRCDIDSFANCFWNVIKNEEASIRRTISRLRDAE